MFDMTPVEIQYLLADLMGARGLDGVPPQIATDALRKTAIDFCTQSTIWEFVDRFQVQYNVADYPLYVPEGTRIASMKWVAINGFVLRPNTSGVRPIAHGWSSNDPNSFYASGQGYSFTMDGRDTVWIAPAPTDTACCDQVSWCAALKPTQDACWLPRGLTEDWNDALTSGAAYRLFTIARQPWSSAGLAMQSRKEYQLWVARARQAKMQNLTQAGIQMTGSYF